LEKKVEKLVKKMNEMDVTIEDRRKRWPKKSQGRYIRVWTVVQLTIHSALKYKTWPCILHVFFRLTHDLLSTVLPHFLAHPTQTTWSAPKSFTPLTLLV
jgi:hypothetical protein